MILIYLLDVVSSRKDRVLTRTDASGGDAADQCLANPSFSARSSDDERNKIKKLLTSTDDYDNISELLKTTKNIDN